MLAAAEPSLSCDRRLAARPDRRHGAGTAVRARRLAGGRPVHDDHASTPAGDMGLVWREADPRGRPCRHLSRPRVPARPGTSYEADGPRVYEELLADWSEPDLRAATDAAHRFVEGLERPRAATADDI